MVRDGALVGLRGGDCVVTATLSLEGVPLRECHQRFDPALVVPVDPPVRLAGEPA